MKYDITIQQPDGSKIRYRNVEAVCQEEAEARALKRAKVMVIIIGSCQAEPVSNARPVSGEEMYNKFFGKLR